MISLNTQEDEPTTVKILGPYSNYLFDLSLAVMKPIQKNDVNLLQPVLIPKISASFSQNPFNGTHLALSNGFLIGISSLYN